MQLFKKDSAYDLALRGFSREYILDKTGVDVGYHGNSAKKHLKGIDREEYKVEFVRQNFTRDEILSAINAYGEGAGKEPTLNMLGLSGGNVIKLKDLFEELGLRDEFIIADKAARKYNMRKGTINKHGVDNVFKLKEFQDKAADTRIKKYGGKYTLSHGSSLRDAAVDTYNEHMADDEFKESVTAKRRDTCMERFGVDVPAKSSLIRKKMEDTMMSRYGVTHYMYLESSRMHMSRITTDNAPERMKKCRATWIKKYGCDNVLSVPETREKINRTNMARYGYPTPLQSPEIYEKTRKTMEKAYGCRYPSESPVLREKRCRNNLLKYGFEYPTQSPKVREKIRRSQLLPDTIRKKSQTNMVRYGYPCSLQSPEVRKKIDESKRENHTFNTSKPEEMLYDMLVNKFGEDDVIRQFSSDKYPYNCDFYITSRDMYIELNASWTHDDHFFDENNPDDIAKLNKWHSLSPEHPFYKIAIETWTVRDINKINAAKKHSLNYAVFWDNNLADALSWFEKGCPGNVMAR